MSKYLTYLLFLSSFVPLLCGAQADVHDITNNFDQYHIGIDNGLPADHIYYMITDKHGYLWVATPDGVARYNGYDLKIFNLSNGLPTNDVWALTEDRMGKIWLGDISNEVGYIYRNEYHRARTPRQVTSFYPVSITPYKDGVIFYSWDLFAKMCGIYRTSNDSVMTLESAQDITAAISLSGTPFFYDNGSLYRGVVENSRITRKFEHYIDKALMYHKLGIVNSYSTDHFLISYNSGDSFFSTVNLHTGRVYPVKTGNYLQAPEPLFLMTVMETQKERLLNTMTAGHIIQFKDDSQLTYRRTYAIRAFCDDTNVNGSNVTSFIQDDLWGNCLATNTKGFYVNYKPRYECAVKRYPDLRNFKYAGSIGDSAAYWWNASASVMAVMDRKGNMVTRKYDMTGDINNIVPYNADSCLVLCKNNKGVHWLMPRTSKLVNAAALAGGNIIGAVINAPRTVVVLAKNYLYEIGLGNNYGERKVLSDDHYQGIVYDSVRHSYWCYNSNKVRIHFSNGADTVISQKALNGFGVKQLDKILIDNSYGNVFLKSNDRIMMYDPATGKAMQVFDNYNFSGSLAGIYDNTLVVAGRFGILFSKIAGRRQLFAPVVYTDVKDNMYNFVADLALLAHKAILNTDKGTFLIDLPADSALHSAPAAGDHRYKLIVNYMDTTLDIVTGDTMRINQKDPVLALDLINPLGNGKVKYLYHLSAQDAVWHELNENVLNLRGLQTGAYVTLSLIAYDNVFRTNETVIYLYVTPYWWQTDPGRAGIILLLLLLFSLSVMLTRRLVLRNAQKRHLRMEIELKAIYAQINPHFIFNTLNSALFMVRKNKMKEADAHISKFSRLLRAYLRSSRNKLITIEDEASNLKNYIELQQERFDNKFEYSIAIDREVDAAHVRIPSLLVQPFVENAINHGLLHSDRKGWLEVAFRHGVSENSIICTITDDGIGRERSKQIKSDERKEVSYGDDLIRDLVSVFNRYEKMNIEIKYTDMVLPETGTRVEILINRTANGK